MQTIDYKYGMGDTVYIVDCTIIKEYTITAVRIESSVKLGHEIEIEYGLNPTDKNRYGCSVKEHKIIPTKEEAIQKAFGHFAEENGCTIESVPVIKIKGE